MAAGKYRLSKLFFRFIDRDRDTLTARLLDKCAKFNSQDEDKICVLIDDLTAKGADIRARDSHGRTVLSLVACQKSLKAVHRALVAGADVNAKDNTDGWTPLLWAATNRDPQMMRVLIKHGADAKYRTPGGWGPVESLLNHVEDIPPTGAECLKLLLDHGSTLDAAQEKEIYSRKKPLAAAVPDIQNALDLSEACRNGDKGKIAEVLARGMHPDIGVTYGDNAALIYLSSKNDVEGMSLLIEAGANVDLVSPLVRKTALLNAATHGCKEACKLLIDSGADETITFDVGGRLRSTAVDFARQTPGLAEYIEELLKERAWAAAHPPDPDVTLPDTITVTRPLQLRRRAP
ncbi:MAG: ankyrin repeat domain-containing protein [Alphaproteobacteria bacterium]